MLRQKHDNERTMKESKKQARDWPRREGWDFRHHTECI